MIFQPTVLILGAGASAPFDFPLGEQLVRLIIRNGDHGQGQFARDVEDAVEEKGRLVPFLKHLRTVEPISIDAFLQRRQEFLEVGKACIARALIPYERPKSLRTFRDHGTPLSLPTDDGPPIRNWVRYLVHQMLPNAPHRRWEDNLLSVVTFNFDRSFERIAFNTIRGYADDDVQALSWMSRIPVFHLHGRLGAPDWLEPDAPFKRPYVPECTSDEVRACANEIRIVHEEIDPAVLAAARKKISTGSNICFLGFSFHPFNLEKLDLTLMRGRSVTGTSFNMPRGQTAAVRSRFLAEANVKFQFLERDADVLQFVQDQDFFHH